MRSFVRATIILTAAAAFVVLSVVGQGLHLLPGCGHRHRALDTACCGDKSITGPVDRGCCDGHGPHHGPKPHGSDSEPPGDPRSAVATCPICRLIAQAKAPAVIAAPPEVDQPVPDEPVHSPLPLLLSPTRAFDARGPPRSA